MNNSHILIGIYLVRLLVWLPRPVRYGLGRFFGGLMYRFGKRRRHITEVNIGLCFPELTASQQQAMVKKVIKENIIGLIDIAVAWFRKPTYSFKNLTIEGEQNLLQAKSMGKGVLLVGAHYTTLDLGALLVSSISEIDGIYRPHNDPRIDRVIKTSREKFCGRMVDRNNMRGVIKSLKDGRVFWYAPDQDYGKDVSVFAPFFGINAATVKFTAKIAKISRAPVVIFSHFRKPDDSGYIVSFSKPLEDYPSGDEVADATRINHELETEIRKYPEQYMWVHRRFKSRPEGEQGFY